MMGLMADYTLQRKGYVSVKTQQQKLSKMKHKRKKVIKKVEQSIHKLWENFKSLKYV